MRSNSRRALRLASALVAAGLALSAAPPALAADDGSLLTLTEGQAEKLADHAQLNPYADADRETVDPQGATKGSGTDGQGSGSHLDEGTGTDGAVTISPKSALEGVRGLAATVPAGGKGGDYFTLHSLGSVQRSKADGTALWRRDNASLYADWGVKNSRPWQTEPYPARIVMGYNAVSPFTPASDQGYVTGDLTGDGVDDVVFSASVGVNPYRPFTSPGSTLPNGTFVTVLDGKTGKTLWSKLYAYAYNVKLVGKTLVVTDAPYYNLNSPATATATVSGLRFAYADGALKPTDTWTYDTEVRDRTAWGALEDLGGGLVAASYNQRKTATTAGRGRTLVLDTTDGQVKWKTDSALYSRQLHLDTARGRLVALEQSDPNDGVKYEIDTYSLADGRRTTLDTRINALPTDMTIGDLRGDRKPEYVVSESTLDPYLYLNSNTVRVVDGTDPATLLWSSTIKRAADNGHDGPSVWSLDVVDGSLVTAAQDDTGMNTAENPGGGQYASLTVFSGSGDVRWQEKGIGASPMFAQAYRDADGRHIRTVDQNQNLRTYGFGNGEQQALLPFQGDLSSSASADLDGDKKNDLVVGGKSNGVWAYSGPSLTAGKPKLLWKATVPGQVHRIEKGDVNGDGVDDFAVAADTAVAVLDGRTGKALERIDGKGQFIRSVTVADLNGDKRADVLVPTDKLRAYRGDGSALWTYAAPDSAGDVVFGDPRWAKAGCTRSTPAPTPSTRTHPWSTAPHSTPRRARCAGPPRRRPGRGRRRQAVRSRPEARRVHLAEDPVRRRARGRLHLDGGDLHHRVGRPGRDESAQRRRDPRQPHRRGPAPGPGRRRLDARELLHRAGGAERRGDRFVPHLWGGRPGLLDLHLGQHGDRRLPDRTGRKAAPRGGHPGGPRPLRPGRAHRGPQLPRSRGPSHADGRPGVLLRRPGR
ncbi:FG-GAP repeat domain-containing protein [Streptomyces aureus]|uniref:FG-GAP repeat domain-containing protein n=1 Tax=Streptomyces aureus TaxID=193461 RepID=UPI0036361BD6